METGVFPSLDRLELSGQPVTLRDISLVQFKRHFCLSRAAAHSDCCFFAPCTNIFTYLLTYFALNFLIARFIL